MRADRLLSILLLLQANGRMCAADLGEKLEVSRRTVYRDLDALSSAGVPVVTDRGPNGGAYLVGGYRTDLTGLTEGELEALLAFGGQGPAADLGFKSQLEGASRKLAVARRDRAGRLRERVLIDSERWFRTAGVPAHLTRMQDALWLDRRVRLRYRRTLDRVVDRVIEPYGLVCKPAPGICSPGFVASRGSIASPALKTRKLPTRHSSVRPASISVRRGPHSWGVSRLQGRNAY